MYSTAPCFNLSTQLGATSANSSGYDNKADRLAAWLDGTEEGDSRWWACMKLVHLHIKATGASHHDIS